MIGGGNDLFSNLRPQARGLIEGAERTSINPSFFVMAAGAAMTRERE